MSNMSSSNSQSRRDDIKNRYYGIKPEKKIRKISNKKFNFGWDLSEDTSAQSCGMTMHMPQFFGRGHLGGIDIKQQRYEQGKYYRKLRKHELDDDQSHVVHWKNKDLKDMDARDWRIFREDYEINVNSRSRVANPIRYWSECNLPRKIYKIIKECGYDDPTPIQRQAIPIGLQNRDIIGVAETGSGKTLAFLIPLLVWISSMPDDMRIVPEHEDLGPFAIILAPTRELALQIEEETLKFSRQLKIKTASIIGGVTHEVQSMKLREGVEIVIATPGRLKDSLENRYLVLSRCTYVVLDEADKMIDMGFEQVVQEILDYMPVSNVRPDTDETNQDNIVLDGVRERFRQTVMFTATMPPSIEKLARNYMRQPATVWIGKIGKAVDRVRQRVLYMKENDKKNRLLDILRKDNPEPPILVFVNLKHTTDYLAKFLEENGFSACPLHGGKFQDKRDNAMQNIKSKAKHILVTTNLLCRGIDIKDVSMVINYDMPMNIQEFTHRIGRTGRAGKTGEAVSFVTEQDFKIFFDLKQMLMSTPNTQIPPEIANHEKAQMKPGTIIQAKSKDSRDVF